MVSNLKQALIIGGASALILLIAYLVNKHYPLVPKPVLPAAAEEQETEPETGGPFEVKFK